jgi:uracil-DNA glycosylase family protein
METSAAAFVPSHPETLAELRAAARHCRGCDLYRYATQTVFGEGPQEARIVLLGQQPGDHEDREGHPFVGPAGKLLNKALNEAGLDRSEVYVSNVVKHFKYKGKGKFRFHQKPTGTEIRACRPWLEAEMQLLHPEVTACLGVSAAEWVLGRKVTIKDERGRLQACPLGGRLLVTVHPASILRIPEDAARHAAYRDFVHDLKLLHSASRRHVAARAA